MSSVEFGKFLLMRNRLSMSLERVETKKQNKRRHTPATAVERSVGKRTTKTKQNQTNKQNKGHCLIFAFFFFTEFRSFVVVFGERLVNFRGAVSLLFPSVYVE